ncbi:hypothetical protein Nepgr_032467 [Nepenthes gracilis]|uniref:K-box domain-containing protein n=1 Tax=Nepenthes gracilis TaxID=150966 RepID=A0AAD3TK21_NEPGR|nr:hypothetical protein Nepgr_032467 [Nepenthes gracilis]
MQADKPSVELESSYTEYMKLKAKYEALQRTQRNLLGEELGPLNVKELDQLEHQLEASLKQIRSTKTQSMLDQLTDLQRKEQALIEANKALMVELEQISTAHHLHQSWGGSEQNVPFGQQHDQCQGLFQPLGCNPSLQTGYNPEVSDQMTLSTQTQVAGFLPGWML